LGCAGRSDDLLQSIEATMSSALTASRQHCAPHVVTLHFRGLGRVSVSSYWLDDPELRLVYLESSHARFGIPTDQPVALPKHCDSSPVVAPTTGYNPTWPANDLPTAFPRQGLHCVPPKGFALHSLARVCIAFPRKGSLCFPRRSPHCVPPRGTALLSPVESTM
jgi:hypothetical protein